MDEDQYEAEGEGMMEDEGDNMDMSQSLLSTENFEEGREQFKKLVHMILGMGESRHIEKICCFFRINRRASLVRQLTMEFAILLTLFMVVVVACFIFYAKFSPSYISDSILDIVDSNIKMSFKNSLLEFSNQINYFVNTKFAWIFTVAELFSCTIGWGDLLYADHQMILIIPRKLYFPVNQPIPPSLIDHDTSTASISKKPITFKTFSYISFHADDASTLSPATVEFLDALDTLSYLQKDFFTEPVAPLTQSFYVFSEERKTLCIYPGGFVDDIIDFDYSTRPWYVKTKQSFILTGIVIPVLSGPYQDAVSNDQIITISLPLVKIVDGVRTLGAIFNIDFILANFKFVLSGVKITSDNVNIAVIECESGLILNDPFNSGTLIGFNDTAKTGFTVGNWDEIQNTTRHSLSDTFIINNAASLPFYVTRKFVTNSLDNTSKILMIVIFGRQLEYTDFRKSLSALIQTKIYTFSFNLLVLFFSIWFLGYFYIYFLARFIVHPLSLVSKLAKGINKNDGKKNSADNLKQQLNQLKVHDANTQLLIDSFVKFIDKHSGLRKIAAPQQPDNSYYNPSNRNGYNPLGYPLNDFQDEPLHLLHDEIAKLPNLGQKTPNADFDYNDIFHNNQSAYSTSSMPSPKHIRENQEEEEGGEYNDTLNEQDIDRGDHNHSESFNSNTSSLRFKQREKRASIKQEILQLADSQSSIEAYCKQLLSSILPSTSQLI